MKIDLFSKLSGMLRPETPEEAEKRLEAEAVRLEARAVHAEKAAFLKKRIADADKRIKVANPSGGFKVNSLKRSTGTKLIIVLVIVIVIIVVISKLR